MKQLLTSASIITMGGCLFAAVQTNPQEASAQNLKTLHSVFALYITDYDDVYPPMSSPSTQVPRTRWADALAPYAAKTDIFTSPAAPAEMATRVFAHTASNSQPVKWGGYGYNYQYLGNSRSQAGNPRLPFGRPAAEISAPDKTVLVAETQGVRFDDGKLSTGVYTLDPPLPSERGTANSSGFYAAGDACGTGPQGCRSTPAEWVPNRVILVTISGNLPLLSRAKLDDLNLDGRIDNGWWNGSGDPAKK